MRFNFSLRLHFFNKFCFTNDSISFRRLACIRQPFLPLTLPFFSFDQFTIVISNFIKFTCSDQVFGNATQPSFHLAIQHSEIYHILCLASCLEMPTAIYSPVSCLNFHPLFHNLLSFLGIYKDKHHQMSQRGGKKYRNLICLLFLAVRFL